MGTLAGWLVFTLLTGLVVLNALGVAIAVRPQGRAELGVVAAGAFHVLIAAPVLVLGYANVLTRTSLAAASLALSAATFALLVRRKPVRAHVRACADAAGALLRLPWDAARQCLAARSPVTLGLAATAILFAEALVLTVLAPSAAWDSFLYHDPIVGFAIQNHGFAILDLPMRLSMQATNGYPRLCESIALWFVVFTDKTLMELPSDLGAPSMMLATYVLVRRFGDPLTAIGWACVLFLMPQSWVELTQTLVDLPTAFFGIAAIAFATRPQLRLQDAACALAATVLLLGAKGSALAFAPAVVVTVYARMLAAPDLRVKRLPAIAVAVAGGTVVAGVALIAPLRNWAAFENPFWPVSFRSPALGVDWHGLATLDEATGNTPLAEAVRTAYGLPTGGMDDAIHRGYGYAILWVLIPIGVLAITAGTLTGLLERAGRKDTTAASNVLLVAILVAAAVVATPTIGAHDARYNLHIVAGLAAAATWLLAPRRWARMREGVLGAVMVLSLIPFAWMPEPGWYWSATHHYEDVWQHPLESRRHLARPAFDMLGRQRDEELGPGDCVAFDGDVDFVGALWNFDLSNRVVYVPYRSASAFVEDVERVHATWVVVGPHGDARKALEATHRWELVGEVTPDREVAFRRRPSLTQGKS